MDEMYEIGRKIKKLLRCAKSQKSNRPSQEKAALYRCTNRTFSILITFLFCIRCLHRALTHDLVACVVSFVYSLNVNTPEFCVLEFKLLLAFLYIVESLSILSYSLLLSHRNLSFYLHMSLLYLMLSFFLSLGNNF